jgi:hypothetical protein
MQTLKTGFERFDDGPHAQPMRCFSLEPYSRAYFDTDPFCQDLKLGMAYILGMNPTVRGSGNWTQGAETLKSMADD